MNVSTASPRTFNYQVQCKYGAAKFMADRHAMPYIVGHVFVQAAEHSLERTQFEACATVTGVRLAMQEMLGEEYTTKRFNEALAKGVLVLADSFIRIDILD